MVAPPAWADGGAARPQFTPVQKAEDSIRPAVVYLTEKLSAYVGDSDGWFRALKQPIEVSLRCSGFVVSPSGYVATAGHCVDPGAEGARREIVLAVVQQAVERDSSIDSEKLFDHGMSDWRIEGQVGGSAIDQTFNVLSGGAAGVQPQSRPARLVDFRPVSQGDVGLLKVEASDMPSSELATDADVQVGQQVISVGFPGSTDQVTDPSMDPDNKDGTVSAKKTAGSVAVYETNAALSGGMSGGPTIGLDGRIVGINSRGPAGETQPFNFIAPASGLAELLSRAGVKAGLGPLDVQFRKGLDDYYAGHYTSAITVFDKIVALAPGYQQATVFKTNATKARDHFGDVSIAPPWKPILALAGGAAVLLAAVVSAVVLLRRRKARTYPATAGAPMVPPMDPPAQAPLDGWRAFPPPAPPMPQPGWPQAGSRPRDFGPISNAPVDEAARIGQLKALAELRDSGALTDEEFEAEKHRILGAP
jgi:hypothetical protein